MQKFLIMKRDLYYKPNDCGYTGIKDYAGRYTLEEIAVRFPNMDSTNQDGTSFIAEDDAPEFTSACFLDYKMAHMAMKHSEAQADIARLQAEVERLKAERRMIVSHATMGATDGSDMTVNGVSCEITRLRNELYNDGSSRANTAHNDAIESVIERLKGCGYVDGDAEIIDIVALKR